MKKSFKYRIYPNIEQKDKLLLTFCNILWLGTSQISEVCVEKPMCFSHG